LENTVKHFTWLAVLASAMAAAEPPAQDAPVVDMAVLEVERDATADDALGAPLKQISKELDRALELQLAPEDEAPELGADYVASIR
tara:strand:- start:205 stop:462 length:258 start_codon:yes stop_codon:yes gene_type:complete